jgi:hypothetical protein
MAGITGIDWVKKEPCGINSVKGTANGEGKMETSNAQFDYLGKKAGAPALPPSPVAKPTAPTQKDIADMTIDAKIDARAIGEAEMKHLAKDGCKDPCPNQTAPTKLFKDPARFSKPEIKPERGDDPAPNPGPPEPLGPWVHRYSKQYWVVKCEFDFEVTWVCKE